MYLIKLHINFRIKKFICGISVLSFLSILLFDEGFILGTISAVTVLTLFFLFVLFHSLYCKVIKKRNKEEEEEEGEEREEGSSVSLH